MFSSRRADVDLLYTTKILQTRKIFRQVKIIVNTKDINKRIKAMYKVKSICIYMSGFMKTVLKIWSEYGIFIFYLFIYFFVFISDIAKTVA